MITIPTLTQLYNRILNDLETEFGNNIPLFGKNYLRIQAMVEAASQKLFYITLGKVQKNIFIDTADPESSGGTLERFGRIKLGRNPYPAQAGQYVVNVTGQNAAIINAGQTFKSDDDSLSPGKLFVLDTSYILSGSGDSITVRALEAGTDSKLIVGDGLTSTAPIANVNSGVIVDAESVPPLDAEDIEDYRKSGIDAYQLEPNGGAPSDFRIWADDAQGVRKVYPFATTGQSAEVDLYIEANPGDSTDGYGTPSAAIISDVEDVVELDPDTTKPINERGRRPLGVFQVHYLPVTIVVIDIIVNDFQGLTVDLQNAIYAAIAAELFETRPFVAGADTLENKRDIYSVNRIISTILTLSPGADFGDVVMLVDSVDLNTYTFTAGNIPRLNTITYP